MFVWGPRSEDKRNLWNYFECGTGASICVLLHVVQGNNLAWRMHQKGLLSIIWAHPNGRMGHHSCFNRPPEAHPMQRQELPRRPRQHALVCWEHSASPAPRWLPRGVYSMWIVREGYERKGEVNAQVWRAEGRHSSSHSDACIILAMPYIFRERNACRLSQGWYCARGAEMGSVFPPSRPNADNVRSQSCQHIRRSSAHLTVPSNMLSLGDRKRFQTATLKSLCRITR